MFSSLVRPPWRRLTSATLSPRPAYPARTSSYSTASGTRPASRTSRYSRRAAFIVVGAGLAYGLDREFNASAIGRNLRTLGTCLTIAVDYKLNFTPEKADEIPALQERVAERVYDLLTSNGGLYIKIGQAIGNNAALLPKPLQEKFGKLFDDAPQVPYSVVDSVFRKEFGRAPAGPDGVFEVFEEQAAASASIAQVHRAKLKTTDGSEQWVAVKIQKPDVGKQVEWDLGAFRAVMWVYENYLFDLPVYFAVDFITDHLRRELDFELEAENARATAAFVASEPRLADRVYIPRVFPSLSTKKIMTAEWIDGVRLSDKRGIARLMGDDRASASSTDPLAADRFPPLRGGAKWVMQTMIDLFSAQIFDWGWVHCDPHPGNVIVRPHPDPRRAARGAAQLVLLDHGLYVRLPREFQQQYARLWKALLTVDFAAVSAVAGEWGIGAPDLFASATLMRPIRFAEQAPLPDFERMNDYERGVAMKEKLKSFLTDTDRMPKQLIFVGRNMRIVQGNNQTFGSPVNRIRITGYWASRSLATSPSLGLAERARELGRHIVFLAIMFSIDTVFWATRVRQWFAARFGRLRGGDGFEDELERTMRDFAKSNFGVDIPENVFDG
ncbi:atypical/ABC1/ABC1-B protein kinase [Trametes versicolor FP-101664 SS1]|uniref:atypical/ABC1/ABC1-B protein kinase n=1 Tax=Trametes versicolor (strain FP-101664) TaxID=717944 RepID=UPI0004623566|nr:atypical/ABC1/ABC1-B protein kinase [Trametes versicolor FP-101664 SS1]EIW54588.1 atypical/ABC1/ABC1-B protein kinase [Trametes versicolor FP-101664 SS1]